MKENILLMMVVLPIGLMSVTSLLIRKRYKEKLKTKHEQINELMRKIEKLQRVIRKRERRNAFRLTVHEPCRFKLISDGLNNEEWFEGIINDISFSGIQIETDLDLSVKQGIKVSIEFQLKKERLTLHGLIVRKEDSIKKKTIIYGIKFVENELNVSNKLNRLIRVVELERKKLRRNKRFGPSS